MNSQKIGILGGIGPQATGYVYSNLISKLKNSGKIKSNLDFPNIIINSINAPELTGSNITIKQLEPYIQGIKQLAILKPDYILMACNTIHIYRDLIIQESGFTNILSIRDIVQNYMKNFPNQTLCIIGTRYSVLSGLYDFEGINYINPSENQLQNIGNIVESYNKTGKIEPNLSQLLKIVYDLKLQGVDQFLTACTEVSELLNYDKKNNYISTLDIMVEELYSRFLGE